MCDYSLEMYRSRRAVEGDKLITARFPSGTVGLIEASAPEATCSADYCAICCQPGDKMQIDGKDAEFVRLETGLHRDAIKVGDEEAQPLHKFGVGVNVTVIRPLPEAITEALEAKAEVEPGHNPLVEAIPAE